MNNIKVEKNKTGIAIIMAVVLTAIFFSCSDLKLSPNFSADIEISIPDSILKGKIYVDGYKYRMDIEDGLETISVIVNQKKGWTWIVFHEQKVYSYMKNDSPVSIESDPFQAVRFHSNSGDKIFLNEETINDFECTKSEIRNGESVYTVWESPELNFPLKIKQNQINIETSLTNINLSSVPDSIFVIPDDYLIMVNTLDTR